YNLPSRILWTSQHSNNPYGPINVTTGAITGDGHNYSNRFLQILQPGDTIRSLVVGGSNPAAADTRIAALQQEVATLLPHPDYLSTTKYRAETLRRADGAFYFDTTYSFGGSTIYAEPRSSSAEPTTGSFVPLVGALKYRPNFGPDLVKKDSNGAPFVARRSDGQLADFDTGLGNFPDGAYSGKADEGNVAAYWYDPLNGRWNYVEPYYTWVYDFPLDTYFSPNRQIPGPVMFGSLPAPNVPWPQAGWKTLLFCPNPAGINHHGAQSPPDHLLLDLFNMPVVEPYAISEPFSTAGKVNLNYPMVPFSYIKRTTALRAALHPLRVTAIPQSFSPRAGDWLDYKGTDNAENLRYLVDRDETLKAFDAFFDKYKTNKNEGFFKSASQICERYLYPKGTVWGGLSVKFTTGEGNIRQFWDRNALTGDNVREKPYADLYPRITTKSNTYTVHYRVQTLRQRAFTGESSRADAHYRTFDQSRDTVLSEVRGSATIERYLDPEDPRFQKTYQPAKDQIDVETQSLEDAYRFRIISNKRFSPW
ncbi:MAG: Verru_Chthon cassette protein A, partial [Chthoniobacteraceae bacterium]